MNINRASGGMLATGNGTVTITAKATDGSGKSATCKVIATVLVSEILFTYNTINVIGGNQSWSQGWRVLPDNAANKKLKLKEK